MLARLTTGLVGVPLAVFLVFYPGGWPFAAAIGIISILGALEFYGGVRKIGVRPVEWAGLLAVALFIVSARTYQASTIGAMFPAVLTLLLILSFCAEMARRERAPIVNVGSTVLGAIYVGWLISHLVVLRGVVPGGVDHGLTVHLGVLGTYKSEVGAYLVMLTFLCTWACDTGAYFIGGAIGRTKLAPRLSPNKTIEGAVAGALCSVLIAGVFGTFINLPMSHALIMGAIFGVLSQIGDLSESAIKRELDIKDSGTLVPGHGGILDRFDSLLFTGPAAYYYTILFLRHWMQ